MRFHKHAGTEEYCAHSVRGWGVRVCSDFLACLQPGLRLRAWEEPKQNTQKESGRARFQGTLPKRIKSFEK